MDKLTLDTNILRDWAWAEERSNEKRYEKDLSKKPKLVSLFSDLRMLRNNGICELGITNQIFSDFEKSVGELPTFIEEMIGSYVTYSTPSISTFPMFFPFVFANIGEIESILVDVFPNTSPDHRKYKSNKKDALQLYAHKIAKRDIFLTSDKKILEAHGLLCKKWGIEVSTLEYYVHNTKFK
jgi:hypothetical protein